MNRVIAMIVLATFFPVQLYASGYDDFNTNPNEYFVPRTPDKPPQVQSDEKLSETILQKPPKAVEVENSGTVWWLWGGLALAAVAGGAVALAGGSKSGGGTSSGGGGGGKTTTTVTGSW